MSLVNSKKNTGYIFMAILIIAFFIFFFSSKLYLPDDSPIIQSKFNEMDRITLEKTGVSLKRWEYNPDNRLMEIEIHTENISSEPFDAKLKFSAKEKRSPQEEIPVNTVFSFDGVTILQIENIPVDYKAVGLYIKETDSEEDHIHALEEESENIEEENIPHNQENEEAIMKLYGDYRKVKENENLKYKTKNEFMEEGIEKEIQYQEIEIENLEEGIPIQDGVVQELEKDIEYLEANKKYQTESEKQSTDNEITQKKNKISEARRVQTAMKKQLETAKEKLEKLKLKKKDQIEKYKESL